ALLWGWTYGPEGLTVAVRIGFDDNRALGEKETGGRTALPIFREIMLRVYRDQLVGPAPRFPRESGEGSTSPWRSKTCWKRSLPSRLRFALAVQAICRPSPPEALD